jgi:hypothetical protein
MSPQAGDPPIALRPERVSRRGRKRSQVAQFETDVNNSMTPRRMGDAVGDAAVSAAVP